MTRFNLPVFKPGAAVTAEDLVRLAQHAEERYFRMLGEPATFAFGLGIFSNELDRVAEANQVRDVAEVEGMAPQEMVRQVKEAFGSRGLRCRQWYFAGGKIPAELRGILEGEGYGVQKGRLWSLERAAGLEERRDLVVIPARGSLRQLGDLAEKVAAGEGKTDAAELAQVREAAVRHMDDVTVEGLLALEDGAAAGGVNLVQGGEMGLLMELRVAPGKQGKGVGTTLLSRAIELAGRSRLRRLCLLCDETNEPAQRLYRKAGFADVAAVERMLA